MTSQPNDLVADSRLESIVSDTHTIHIFYESSSTTGKQRVKREERWTRKQNLGQGAYSTVRLETSRSDDQIRVRAVKEITRLKNTSSRYVMRELEAIAKFSGRRYRHCFVRSYGWYETDHAIFIAMEYMKLGDLNLYLEAPLPEEEAGLIAGQLVEGLRFMHRSRFIHRDVKPQNILVQAKGPNWWVKLADFGIARRLREPREDDTVTTRVFGTPGYTAPEIVSPDFVPKVAKDAAKDCMFAVDSWGLGVVVFRMIFNRLPFPTTLQLSKYALGVDNLSLKDGSVPRLSALCQDFIKGALSLSPAERPSMEKAWAYEWIQSTRATTSSTKLRSTTNSSGAVAPPADVPAAQLSTVAYRPKNQSCRDEATYSLHGAVATSLLSLDQDPGAMSPASTRWTTSAEIPSSQSHPGAVSPLAPTSTSHQPRGQGSHKLPTATARGLPQVTSLSDSDTEAPMNFRPQARQEPIASSSARSSSQGSPEVKEKKPDWTKKLALKFGRSRKPTKLSKGVTRDMSSSQVPHQHHSPEAVTLDLWSIIPQSRRLENLAISPNGQFVAFASLTFGLTTAPIKPTLRNFEVYREVEIWETGEKGTTGRRIQKLLKVPIDVARTVPSPLTVEYAPDGSQLLVQHLGHVDIFDVNENGRAILRRSQDFAEPSGPCVKGYVTFTHDSEKIVIVMEVFEPSGDNGKNGSIAYHAGIWSYRLERSLVTLVLDTSSLVHDVSREQWGSRTDRNIHLVAGGHLFLSDATGDILHAWHIPTVGEPGSEKQLHPSTVTLGGHSTEMIFPIALSENGKYLVSKNFDDIDSRIFSEFKLWATVLEARGLRRLESALLVPTFHDSDEGPERHEAGIYPNSNHAISSDGRWCAVAPCGRRGSTGTTVGLYHVRTGELRGTIDLGNHKMTDQLDILQFSPNSKLLFTRMYDQPPTPTGMGQSRIKVWDLRKLV
ncbi:kinase-like domain-containing protein [Cercophora newfieldiana]|uniref:non-specific serine/threonine protein kinase n=1 Tax=Cercophora newfieldiana TaxID=92897 RepID=A0AA39YHA7_9PEZI|nr:kinase-like domain-containing protein [Cercophora newfieldiana]